MKKLKTKSKILKKHKPKFLKKKLKNRQPQLSWMGGKLSKKAWFRPLFKCKVIKLIKWSDLCVKLHQDERGWPSVRHRDEEPRDAGQGLPEGGGAGAGGVLPGPGLPQHPPLLLQLPPVVHRVQADVRFPGQIPHSRSVVTNTIFQSFCFYYNLCIPKGFFYLFWHPDIWLSTCDPPSVP